MIKTISTAVLILLSINTSFSQEYKTVRDFELWTGATVKKSFLEKQLTLGLTQEFRLDDNSTRLDAFFTELEAKYKLENGLSVGGAFRFIRNKKNSGDINEGRFNLDLGYKYKFDRLSLSSRLRYQNKNQLGITRDEGDYAVSKFRLRLKAEYNIKNWKLDPYVSAELFYAQTKNQIVYIDDVVIEPIENVNGFEKMRYTIGTNYKINKLISVGGFYRIEQEFKSYPLFYNTPATYYIGGVNVTFKL